MSSSVRRWLLIHYEGPNFTEYECGDIQTNAGSPMTCWMAHTTECTEVRDWYD